MNTLLPGNWFKQTVLDNPPDRGLADAIRDLPFIMG